MTTVICRSNKQQGSGYFYAPKSQVDSGRVRGLWTSFTMCQEKYPNEEIVLLEVLFEPEGN